MAFALSLSVTSCVHLCVCDAKSWSFTANSNTGNIMQLLNP